METGKISFERISSELDKNRIVLFMKGDRQAPQCGFSAKVVGILDSLLDEYHTVDVLRDPDMRNDVKQFSDWPTIPQLYVEREFVGGCDLVEQLHTSGELHRRLGVDESKSSFVPDIHVSNEAAEVITQALAESENGAVHLTIDKSFNHNFEISPIDPKKYRVTSNGVEIFLDKNSCLRASGLEVGMADSSDGYGFKIFNPNVGSKVEEITVQELKRLMESKDDFHLFDVRTLQERQIANIEKSILLDEDAVELINKTDRSTRLIFFCHSGVRSEEAARYFFDQGYSKATNLIGGIDAWSLHIDSSVPRY